jgi:hypothetical protein
VAGLLNESLGGNLSSIEIKKPKANGTVEYSFLAGLAFQTL